MKKVLIFCGIVAYILLATGAPKMPKTQPKLGAIVRLHDVISGRFFCSGTVISDSLVLTAAHCLAMPVGISVRTIDGVERGVLATVVNADSRGDLGLIKGDFKQFEKLPISIEPDDVINSFKYGRVQACGYPRAGKLWCTKFTFKAAANFQFAGDGTLYPGMSGGPVIDMVTGNVIGVNTAVDEYGRIILSPIIELWADLDVNPE